MIDLRKTIASVFKAKTHPIVERHGGRAIINSICMSVDIGKFCSYESTGRCELEGGKPYRWSTESGFSLVDYSCRDIAETFRNDEYREEYIKNITVGKYPCGHYIATDGDGQHRLCILKKLMMIDITDVKEVYYMDGGEEGLCPCCYWEKHPEGSLKYR